MSVSEVKSIFHDLSHKIGHRDCKVMGSSALTG